MDILWLIVIILIVAWVVGFGAFHVTTAFIHLLIALAIIIVIIKLLQRGRI